MWNAYHPFSSFSSDGEPAEKKIFSSGAINGKPASTKTQRVMKKILIIDDSKPIRYLLDTIISKYYQVITASDGYEAMYWLSQGNRPDVIISDLQMPNINGWDLVKNLTSSAIYGNIPIIILSGSSNDEIVQKCEEYGVADFLVKPFNPSRLLEAIKKALDKKAGMSVDMHG
ncbi:MAG: response regulator [Thermoflavifilum sp.]|nr:response regulator [Thermoflavifilum sp.]